MKCKAAKNHVRHTPVYTPVSNSIAVPLLDGLETLISWPDIAAEVPVTNKWLQCFAHGSHQVCGYRHTRIDKLTKEFCKRIRRAPSPRTVTLEESIHTDQASEKHGNDCRARGLVLLYGWKPSASIHTTNSEDISGILPAQTSVLPCSRSMCIYGFGAMYCSLRHKRVRAPDRRQCGMPCPLAEYMLAAHCVTNTPSLGSGSIWQKLHQ